MLCQRTPLLSENPMPVPLTVDHLKYMNIGERFWEAERAKFTLEQCEKIVPYLAGLENYVRRGVGLYLWGDNNVGKSYVSAVLCKSVWGAYRVASYCVLASELKDAWSRFEVAMPAHDGSSESMSDRVEQVRFLVVDDLGKEHRTSSGFAEDKFSALLRSRSRSIKTTVITSNMSPTEFSSVYGRSSGQLAKECMIVVHLTGKDQRETISRSLTL
jgi:DNA replication protein DnaC